MSFHFTDFEWPVGFFFFFKSLVSNKSLVTENVTFVNISAFFFFGEVFLFLFFPKTFFLFCALNEGSNFSFEKFQLALVAACKEPV